MIPERKDNPLVICGFPGIGKSMFASYMKENEHRDDILDLDSKPFKAKDVNHPDRYCKEIEKAYLSKQYSYILVSCHKKLREYLQDHGIPYIIVMPEYYENKDESWTSVRNEYMKRYLSRGDTVAFMQKIYDNWKDWMAEMRYYDPAPKIQIHKWSYIDDIFNPIDDKGLQGL